MYASYFNSMHYVKLKLDLRKNLFLSLSCIDFNNASLTEIGDGLIIGIFAKK